MNATTPFHYLSDAMVEVNQLRAIPARAPMIGSNVHNEVPDRLARLQGRLEDAYSMVAAHPDAALDIPDPKKTMLDVLNDHADWARELRTEFVGDNLALNHVLNGVGNIGADVASFLSRYAARGDRGPRTPLRFDGPLPKDGGGKNPPARPVGLLERLRGPQHRTEL